MLGLGVRPPTDDDWRWMMRAAAALEKACILQNRPPPPLEACFDHRRRGCYRHILLASVHLSIEEESIRRCWWMTSRDWGLEEELFRDDSFKTIIITSIWQSPQQQTKHHRSICRYTRLLADGWEGLGWSRVRSREWGRSGRAQFSNIHI
jgi:hypothetical protein